MLIFPPVLLNSLTAVSNVNKNKMNIVQNVDIQEKLLSKKIVILICIFKLFLLHRTPQYQYSLEMKFEKKNVLVFSFYKRRKRAAEL